MSWKATLPICAGLFLLAGAITYVIFSTEPGAQRGGATKRTAMLVEVTGVQAGDFRPEIVALGIVRPRRDIELAARVRGEVIERAPSFTPGGVVEQGATVLALDPADYRNALEARRSELRQAQAELIVERGRHYVAQQDLAAFSEELPPERRSLALREPQLDAARARVEAAEAAVAQAELELARTTITAPFDALVLSRHVNVGSQVAPGETLARLVGVESYWVEATVPLSKLPLVAFPKGDERGVPVKLRNRTAWTANVHRVGHMHDLIGAIDDRTRLARVLISIRDPLARAEGAGPKLIIGEILEARIPGEVLRGVVRVEREYLRSGDTVWTMEDGVLRIRDVAVAFRDERYAYIASGLDGDAQVVTTDLSTVIDGAELRLGDAESGGGAKNFDGSTAE